MYVWGSQGQSTIPCCKRVIVKLSRRRSPLIGAAPAALQWSQYESKYRIVDYFIDYRIDKKFPPMTGLINMHPLCHRKLFFYVVLKKLTFGWNAFRRWSFQMIITSLWKVCVFFSKPCLGLSSAPSAYRIISTSLCPFNKICVSCTIGTYQGGNATGVVGNFNWI